MSIEGIVGLVFLAAFAVFVWKKVTAEKDVNSGGSGGGNGGSNKDSNEKLK